MGVLFGGETTCRGIDYMTRTDSIAAWIDEQIRSTWADTVVDDYCADLDYRGRCVGDTVEWCNENFQLQRKDCAELDSVCTFVNEDKGYLRRPARWHSWRLLRESTDHRGWSINATYVGACSQPDEQPTLFG